MDATFHQGDKPDEDVLQQFDSYLVLHPNDVNAHTDRARILDALGRSLEAEEAFREALRLDPCSAKALHYYGVFCAKRGKYDIGIDLMHRSLEQSDEFVVWYDLGVAYSEAYLPRDAVRSYREALRTSPDSTKARWNLAIELYELGWYEQALEQWDFLEPEMQLSPDLCIRKADTLLALDYVQDAVDLYRVAIKLSHGDAFAYHRLGVALEKIYDFDGAAEAYQNSVHRDSLGNDSWINMGIVLDRLGRYTEAQAAYRQALVIDPQDSEAFQNLGASYAEEGRAEEALDAFRTAVSINPDNLGALLAIGQTLWEVGRDDEAKAIFREVLRRDPGNGFAREALADMRD